MATIKETLSSDTLFHFTSKHEYLISILQSDFAPRYCLENLTMLGFTQNDKIQMEVAVPMVCFCDIPLSKIKFHLNCYGGYGIGMTKAWGIKNGISPVLYANPKSETVMVIKEILKIARLKVNQINDVIINLGNSITHLTKFVKPYKGNFVHRGKTHRNRRYYDEREWRYVPIKASIAFLNKNEFLDTDTRARADWVLNDNCKLKFSPNDIEYIIVKNKSEVLQMIKDIMAIKYKYTDDEKMLLASKIISKDKIIKDF